MRYMSLGDSLAAAYKAQPATKGYVYLLYLGRVFGSIPDTVFDNAAVPGATSTDVLNYQIPQVPLFEPNVVAMSVGGNDLLGLLGSPDPVGAAPAVLQQFAGNMIAILNDLCANMPPDGQIYVHDLYTIPEIPGENQVVPLFNDALVLAVSAAQNSPGGSCTNLSKTIKIADIYNAFLGKHGLLLIERYLMKGIEVLEPHPTDKGYRVMEDALRAVLRQ
jgi:lysophospholipase L1-like esterase